MCINWYSRFGKRIFDLVFSGLGIVVLFFPMMLVILAILADSPGGAFYVQRRLGKDLKEFNIIKLRTMVRRADQLGSSETFENDFRITSVGSFLRRYSIDELPQLINICLGDMSIIGPRPLPKCECLEFLNQGTYMNRWDISPGLFCTVDTDLRALADINTQFEMDVDYVRNISFLKDTKIFLSVIRNVITGRNVYKKKGGEEV